MRSACSSWLTAVLMWTLYLTKPSPTTTATCVGAPLFCRLKWRCDLHWDAAECRSQNGPGSPALPGVAVRAGRYEIVRILLAAQTDVNCYFTEVNDTVFSIALQYCLKDEEMMQLLLNNVYDVGKCFHCHHDFHFNMGFAWKDMHLHKPRCYICDGGDKKIPVSFGPDYKKVCSKAYIDNILSTLFPAS